MPLLLVRYNELGLKSPRVRTRFQAQLVKNIERKFMDSNIECLIDSLWGRIFVRTSDIDSGLRLLTRVFGISSISVAESGEGGLDEIIDFVVKYSEPRLKQGCTFAIRSRRFGRHDFTSIQLAEKLGSALLDEYGNRGIKVNLKSPEVEVHVEVRNREFYVFSDKHTGTGGMPLGTQGRVLGIYENENSFLAWWLIMKRGATVIPIYFSNGKVEDPTDPLKSLEDISFKDNLNKIREWAPGLKVRPYNIKYKTTSTGKVNFTSLFANYIHIIDELAGSYRVDGIVTGIGMDEFQNELQNIRNENVSKYPIFVPLAGLSEDELIKLKKQVLG